MKSLLLLLFLISTAFGYKILGIFPMPSRSHTALAKGIVQSLLNAGHEVTWVCPYPDQKQQKNLTLIDVSDTVKIAEGIDMMQHGDAGISFVRQFGTKIATVAASNKQLQEVLVKEQFDAVITEYFFSETDAGYAAIQQVPWLQLSGMVLMPILEQQVDDVRSVSTVPMVMNDYPLPMNFFQRICNSFIYLMIMVGVDLEKSATISRYESFFEPLAKARGVRLPPFNEAYYNLSILFVNSHPSVAPALSLPPNVVDIAGFHIDEAQPLPKDIKAILDGSPQGVVYFSMGSVLKSALIPLHTRQELISMFSELPYTVLWKFEEDIEGLPKNIIVKKWWPQAGVLAHPNVKLFITHGGMLSTLEAVHYGVPLLAVPVFGDQPSNAARAVRSGYALKVPYSEHMGPELRKALKEMTTNDGYYKQAKYLSKIFNKRPVHPSKLISHYVELAIESKGAFHLRSKTFLYSWYQRWMLDQLAAVIVVVYLIYCSIRRIICSFSSKKQEGKKLKKK